MLNPKVCQSKGYFKDLNSLMQSNNYKSLTMNLSFTLFQPPVSHFRMCIRPFKMFQDVGLSVSNMGRSQAKPNGC